MDYKEKSKLLSYQDAVDNLIYVLKRVQFLCSSNIEGYGAYMNTEARYTLDNVYDVVKKSLDDIKKDLKIDENKEEL